MTRGNTEFELRGVHHLAPVCSDRKQTVDFSQGVLGMLLQCHAAVEIGL